jgi:hypothetical protein
MRRTLRFLYIVRDNILKFDKFHDFLTLFMFYTFLKQLNVMFTAMFREHGDRKFRYVTEIGRNLC